MAQRSGRRGRATTDARRIAAIFAGGCVGAVARAEIALAAGTHVGQWPWASFMVNIAGAFALGWWTSRLSPGSVRLSLLGTGFCGALTTFSTMQLELLRMVQAGDGGLAAAYAAGSVVCGLAAAAAAIELSRRVGRSP